jgi:hypothetical protein
MEIRKRISAIVAASLIAIGNCLLATSVSAATNTQAAPPHIFVTSITTWVTPKQDLSISVTVSNAKHVDKLRMQLLPRVTAEQQISRWISKGYSGRVLKTLSYDNNGASHITTTFTIPSDDSVMNSLALNGAYPVSVSALSSTSKPLTSERTFFVSKPKPTSDKTVMNVNVVYQLYPSALSNKTGTLIKSSVVRKSVDNILDGLINMPNVPFSLYLYGDTSHALLPNETTYGTKLRTLLQQREYLGGQWGTNNDLSLNSVAVKDQINRSISSFRSQNVRVPTLAWNASLGTTNVVARSLSEKGAQVLIASTQDVRSRKSSQTEFLVKDPLFKQSIVPTDDIANATLVNNSPAGVENCLAALTARYLFHPNQLERHIVLLTPQSKLLNAANTGLLLTSLNGSGFVRLETMQDQLKQKPYVGVLTTHQQVRPSKKTTVARTETESELADFDSFVLANNKLSSDLHGALLTSNSTWISNSQRSEYWSQIRHTVSEELAKILAPPNTRVRLTTQKVTMPVTIRSLAGYPVKLVVDLESARIKFLNGSKQTLLVTRASDTAKFLIQAQSSGTFPIKVVVRSATRKAVVGQSLITVNAFSTTHAGYFLSVAALAVLALWWGRYIWLHRRKPYTP